MGHDYHTGEVEAQTRAGVRDIALKLAKATHASIPPIAQQFLEAQVMVVLATMDREGEVWASLVTGQPGFARATAPATIEIEGRVAGGDPLPQNLEANQACGMIAVEFSSRRRMRANGRATLIDGRIVLEAREIYSNCPRYIQERHCTGVQATTGVSATRRGKALTPSQIAWVSQADTFFIATTEPETGADASHKGGYPGFVQVDTAETLLFPDYNGNCMFNTIGNIARNPKAGLLFLDFDTGAALQLTGRTEVLWEDPLISTFPGAERLVRFDIDGVIETPAASLLSWQFDGYSRHLPGLPKK